MSGSGGYRRLPGGSDHFSLHTNRTASLYIYHHHPHNLPQYKESRCMPEGSLPPLQLCYRIPADSSLHTLFNTKSQATTTFLFSLMLVLLLLLLWLVSLHFLSNIKYLVIQHKFKGDNKFLFLVFCCCFYRY